MTTPEHYQRLEELFDAAASLPREQWEAYLDAHCDDPVIRRQVEAMLATDQQTDPALQTPAMLERFRNAAAELTVEEQLPERIGGYRIRRCMGRGGMGIVYEAEQESPRRRVALKVMRRGILSRQMVQRFKLEAHVLGQLHHPGIAQIYESGLADDGDGAQPYFAMELIVGKSLSLHVKDRQSSVRERVELMAQLAEAVQHAHQKGVIHRDLKPDNVMIDEEGQLKVLDFGVARATDSDVQVTTLQTDAGQIIGTLAYMSPEQVTGHSDDLDTRSDVYSLGVIMYELLTGQLPLDLTRQTVPNALRMIQESTPRRLSAVNTRLRGDLETIVSKAMEKEKPRRYQTAAEFAADLRRYLRNEPIMARPPSAVYQFRKFAVRNKAIVTGAAAVFLVLLIGLITSTALYLRSEANLSRALQAEAEATRESEVASEVSAFLVSLFEVSDPEESRGREFTAREMLDRGAQRIREELEPGAVQARLMHVMGVVYVSVGDYAAARPLIEDAYDMHASIYPPDHPLVMAGRRYRAQVYMHDGEFDEALAVLEESLRVMEQAAEPDPAEEWETLVTLVGVRMWHGEYEEMAALSERCLAIAEALPEEARRGHRLGISYHQHAVSLYYLGDLERAEAEYRQAIALFRDLYGETHPLVASSLSALGLALNDRGQLEDAEVMLREALQIEEVLWGPDHGALGRTMSSLAIVLRRMGRLEEAEALLRRIIDIHVRSVGPDHPKLAGIRANLASVLLAQEKFPEAETLLQRALETQLDVFGRDHRETMITIDNQVRLYIEMERWDEAEPLLREQWAMYRGQAGEASPPALWMMGQLGETLRQQGRLEEARSLREQELALRREHQGLGEAQTLAALMSLAELLIQSERSADASALLAEHHARLVSEGLSGAAAEAAELAATLYETVGQTDESLVWRGRAGEIVTAEK